MSKKIKTQKGFELSKDVIDDFLHILPAVLYEYVLYDEGKDSEFLYLSPASEQILGFPPQYFVEDMSRFWEMVHPDDLKRLQEEDRTANQEGVHFYCEIRLQRPSGKTIWLQLSSKPTNKIVSNAAVWFGYMIDITRQKELEEELYALATIDSLTQVLNRRSLLEKLDEAVGRAQRYQHSLSVAFCDLDHFKSINDTHGHAMGDEALKQFASVVMESLRESDFVGRIGGEEFALVFPYSDSNEASRTVERLRHAIEKTTVNIDDNVIQFTVSIGISELQGKKDSSVDLLRRADAALYQAKDSGRNRVVVDPAS